MSTHRKLYLRLILIIFRHKLFFSSLAVPAQSEPIYGLYAEVVFNPPDEIIYPEDDTDQNRDPRDGPYFQGDILNPPEEFLIRGITPIESRRWDFATVFYSIDKIYTKEGIKEIEGAMYEIETKTSGCVLFQYWYSDLDVRDYVYINWEKKGCSSFVGKIGGKQLLNLEAPHCFSNRNIIVHELLHVLGFHHEQSRWDRDEYVGINWWNIEDGRDYNFDKYYTVDYGVPYDYNSIMHYKANAFAKDRSQYTVYSKKPEGDDSHSKNERKKITENLGLGGLSEGDIKQIRRMYHCEQT